MKASIFVFAFALSMATTVFAGPGQIGSADNQTCQTFKGYKYGKNKFCVGDRIVYSFKNGDPVYGTISKFHEFVPEVFAIEEVPNEWVRSLKSDDKNTCVTNSGDTLCIGSKFKDIDGNIEEILTYSPAAGFVNGDMWTIRTVINGTPMIGRIDTVELFARARKVQVVSNKVYTGNSTVEIETDREPSTSELERLILDNRNEFVKNKNTSGDNPGFRCRNELGHSDARIDSIDLNPSACQTKFFNARTNFSLGGLIPMVGNNKRFVESRKAFIQITCPLRLVFSCVMNKYEWHKE